jgi:SAM-dependent methyltransferase
VESFANPEVLGFYRELPFNMWGSDEDYLAAIKSGVSLRNQPPLDALLDKTMSVLEVGCGVGWFSCQMARAHGCRVTGIDFNPVVVEVARRTARSLELPVTFEVADLFTFSPAGPADVCVTLGVLHHTDNCHAAIRKCLTDFVKPGGHLYLGLYHRAGRQPFLDHFRALRASGASQAECIAEFARLRGSTTDDVHLLSWYRDQVEHPHETQHTLAEVIDVVGPLGGEVVSTSINRFQPLSDVAEVLAMEAGLEVTARDWLARGRYFPGFFTALIRRRPSS